MPRVWTLAVLLIALAMASCEDRTPPPAPSPSPGGGETITGRERLGWDQRADSSADLATFGYAVYVDGARAEVAEVVCAVTAGDAGFACTGRLPAMSAGAHTLELAVFRQAQPGIESPRSGALRVTVTGSLPDAAGETAWTTGEAGSTADGVALVVERLAAGLDRPTDAAFDAAGRLFISERGGTIRIFDTDRLVPRPALAMDDVTADGGLLSIAVAPDFSETRHVFTLSTAPSRQGPVFRLARYRELRGILAQRAILFETPAPPGPAGALRFGPDAKLYVALGPASTDDPSSYLGKVLRLNADGTAPRDRQSALPIFADGVAAPHALAWHADGQLLWIADGDGRDEWVTGIAGADAAAPRASWAIPDGVSALATYDDERVPAFRGNVFLASPAARQLLRLRLDREPLRVAGHEALLTDRAGPIRIVLAGPDGALYFCTDSELGRLSSR
jgi:glucose/arabinose dehydrogenase